MRTAAPALQTFIDGWEAYNRRLLDALRPLSPEHLALKPAPHQWAVWQIASHVAGARMSWIHDCLHEPYAGLRDTFRVRHDTVPNCPSPMRAGRTTKRTREAQPRSCRPWKVPGLQ